MLEPLEDMPEGVIGFTAVGEIHADDYRYVLQPALQQALDRGEKVRIVLEFPSFDGISPALPGRTSRWVSSTSPTGKRIVLAHRYVEWMIQLTQLFGWMHSRRAQALSTPSERDDAVDWAAAG